MLPLLLKKDNGIEWIKVNRTIAEVTHLMYADDFIVACRADDRNTIVYANYLNLNCDWPSQMVNAHKLSLIFSKNTLSLMRKRIRKRLGV